MALSATHYLEQKVLSAIFNNTSFSVSNVYIALFTVAPDKTGGGTEVNPSGTSYARQLLAPTLSGGVLVYSPQDATGSTIQFADVTFPTATGGGYGTLVAVALFDALSGGNMLYFASISSVTVGAGVTYTLPHGNLTALQT